LPFTIATCYGSLPCAIAYCGSSPLPCVDGVCCDPLLYVIVACYGLLLCTIVVYGGPSPYVVVTCCGPLFYVIIA
jgi:hypothetical protein